MQYRNREKQNDKKYHEKASFSFIHLRFTIFFVLLLKRLLHFHGACYLFMEGNVQTNIKEKISQYIFRKEKLYLGPIKKSVRSKKHFTLLLPCLFRKKNVYRVVISK